MSLTERLLIAESLQGFCPASEAWFWAKVLREKSRDRFVRITRDLKTAHQLLQNLEFFQGRPSVAEKVIFFPPYNYPPYTGIEGSPETMAERVAVLQRLQRDDGGLLILPWEAALRGTLPPAVLRQRQWTLRRGEEVERRRLLNWLVESGYQKEILVESIGQFAVRGELIDIFSPYHEQPVRLEFFGDQIEGLRTFDPATQTSVKKVNEVVLIPAIEMLFNEDSVRLAKSKIKKWQEDLNVSPTLRREVVEKIETKIPFTGLETFLPAFFEKSASIFDYFSEK